MSFLLWHTQFLLFDSILNIRFMCGERDSCGRVEGRQVKLSVVSSGGHCIFILF